ncbi:hypothetical protein PFISCL1PPCAC_9244, partial [Pristionchus fissidentatus]
CSQAEEAHYDRLYASRTESRPPACSGGGQPVSTYCHQSSRKIPNNSSEHRLCSWRSTRSTHVLHQCISRRWSGLFISSSHPIPSQLEKREYS